MPYRNTDLAAAACTASLFPALSDQDWARAIGPFGGLFVSLAMLAFFVFHAARRQRKDDAREKAADERREKADAAAEVRAKEEAEEKERRHKEQLEFQERMQNRVMDLVAESIKADMRVCQAINAMSKSNELVHVQLGELTDAIKQGNQTR